MRKSRHWTDRENNEILSRIKNRHPRRFGLGSICMFKSVSNSTIVEHIEFLSELNFLRTARHPVLISLFMPYSSIDGWAIEIKE